MKNDLLSFYFSFEGRASRYDFNVRYALVVFVGAIIAMVLDFFVINHGVISMEMREPFSNFWNVLIIVPTLAITCRRLHDLNYSGWWQLFVHAVPAICIVFLVLTLGAAALFDPLVAGATGFFALFGVLVFYLIFFLVISVKRGTKGPNKFGSDPLEKVMQ